MSRKSFPFRSTGGDLRDLDQPGYYCGFSTMAQKKSWDEATQDVVSERIEKIPPIRFFSPEEAAVLDAVRQKKTTVDVGGILATREAGAWVAERVRRQ